MIPRIAELIASEEGYNVPGSVPERSNNPGDLRHSPHSYHLPSAPNAIGEIDTPADGWADLVRQLNLYVKENPNITIAGAIYCWAPPNENNSQAYLTYVLNGLGCTGDALLSDVLKIPGIGVYADEPT